MEAKLAGRIRSTTGDLTSHHLGQRTPAIGPSAAPDSFVSANGISRISLTHTRADTKSHNCMIFRSFHQQDVMRPR